MKIEKVSAAPDRVGRYKVTFSDGSSQKFYRQTVEDFCLYAGKELNDSEYEALVNAAGQMSAKMRAVRMLAASNVSRKDLQQRLIRKGESPEDADAAVRWMTDLDLLDDRKTAQQIVSSCIRKGYGAARARQALYEKRIPKELWEEAMEDYPQQREPIEAYLRSRLSSDSDSKEIRRAIDSLLRKGHSYGVICAVLAQLSFDTDELPEE